MSKEFGIEEHRILNLFKKGESFIFNDNQFIIIKSGKPTCPYGEPKTDIYVLAEEINNSNHQCEIKISFKKQNADFLENKISAERAEQLLGSNWSTIISNATKQLKHKFSSRPLIYKDGLGRVEEGSITLGWKFEFLNVLSGELSGTINLTNEQALDIYAGTNLSQDKQDANVDGETIYKSGVANFVLFEDNYIPDLQSAVNELIPIETYAYEHSDIYFACKALNYRTYPKKYDGNRPLSVYVNWFVSDNKLSHEICYDQPLEIGGDYVANNLLSALSALNINTTKDINTNNIDDTEIVNGNL